MPSTRAISRSGSIERRRAASGLAALLLAVLAAACLPVGAAHADGPTYRVAVMEATPPFSHRAPDGTLTGFNVEIMQALCSAMNTACRFDEVTFQEVLEGVAAGRFDYGLANFLRTPEREARVAFSAPYWRSSSSFVGVSSEIDRPAPEGVSGHSVAAIRGTGQHTYLKRMGAKLSAVVEVAHLAELWQALREGRAEFALVPTLAALSFLISDEGKAHSTIGDPLTEEGLGGTVHIVMPPGRGELKSALDAAITTIRRTGAYQEVNRRYFPFDVY